MKPSSSTLTAAAVALCLGVASLAHAQQAMSVQVKEAPLRQTPQTLGKVQSTLTYGQRVRVIEESGQTWSRIQTDDGLTGWVRSSQLTKKKLKIESDPAAAINAANASAKDIAMAGKGFNKTIEDDRRATGTGPGYNLLDQIDNNPATTITPEQLQAFIAQGRLSQENPQ